MAYGFKNGKKVDYMEMIWIKIRPIEWFKENAYIVIDSPDRTEYWESEEIYDKAVKEDADYLKEEEQNYFCYTDEELNRKKRVYEVKATFMATSIWGADIIDINDHPEYRI